VSRVVRKFALSCADVVTLSGRALRYRLRQYVDSPVLLWSCASVNCSRCEMLRTAATDRRHEMLSQRNDRSALQRVAAMLRRSAAAAAQGCNPKKRSGGTPETRLRQRFFKQFRPTYTYSHTRQKNCHSGLSKFLIRHHDHPARVHYCCVTVTRI